MGIPYAAASTGDKARREVKKILRRLGCDKIGFMDDDAKHEVMLAFSQRGRSFQLPASAKGWAALYLRSNPWTNRHRKSRVEYEQTARRQGHIAVNSILRDWVKGQATAVRLASSRSRPRSCRTC